MKPKVPLLVLALLLGLASPSAAASPIMAGSAQSVSLDGSTGVAGDLSSFHSIEYGQTDSLPGSAADRSGGTAPQGIVLTGTEVRVFTEIESQKGSILTLAPNPDRTTEERHFDQTATFVADAPRPFFYFFVVPVKPGSASVGLGSEGGSLQAASKPAETSSRYVQTDRASLASPAADVEMWSRPLAWRNVHIAGDFALTVWEIDFAVHEKSSAESLRSGYFFDSNTPVSTEPYNVYGDAESRQMYIYVRNGTLDFTFDQTPTAILALQARAATSQAGTTFTGVSGHVQLPDGSRTLTDDDLSLDGSFDLSFGAVSGDRFAVQAEGQPTSATLDGKVYRYPAGAAVSPLPAGTLSIGLAATGVVAFVAAVAVRRRRLARSLADMEGLMEAGAYAQAAAAARPALLRSRRHGTDAQVMRTVSLLRLGRLAEAQASLDGWQGTQTAAVDYLWAFLHAVRGEAKDVKRRVAACLAKDPGMRQDLESNPAISRILAQGSSDRRTITPREGYS